MLKLRLIGIIDSHANSRVRVISVRLERYICISFTIIVYLRALTLSGFFLKLSIDANLGWLQQ